MGRRNQQRSMSSWTGTGEVITQSGRRSLAWPDTIAIAAVAFIYDLAATLAIGTPTAAGGIECTDTACNPPPDQVIHTALLGVVLMITAAALPVVLALILRRAIVAVVIIQLIAGAAMVSYASANLSLAHENKLEICRNAPELSSGQCPAHR